MPLPKRTRLQETPRTIEQGWFATNQGRRWIDTLVYPRRAKYPATIRFDDLERLDEGEWLNDEIINFYIRYLQHDLEKNQPDAAKSIYYFNTFFYPTLVKLEGQLEGHINYEGVRRWVKEDEDLFNHEYVFIPIHEDENHWYLVFICHLPALLDKADLG